MKWTESITNPMFRFRRRIATGGVALLALWIGYHVVLGDNGMLVYQKKRAEYQRLDQEIQSVQQENERLNQHIKALKTDPKTIEKEAREQLRYTRPGEVVYTIPTNKSQQPATNFAQNQKK